MALGKKQKREIDYLASLNNKVKRYEINLTRDFDDWRVGVCVYAEKRLPNNHWINQCNHENRVEGKIAEILEYLTQRGVPADKIIIDRTPRPLRKPIAVVIK